MHYNYEEMEMPTPCVVCGKIFDLNDGYGSEKWHPNTIICEECFRKEEKEIEEDERWEEINLDIINALYVIKDEDILEKLDDDNKSLILNLAKKLVPKESIRN